MFFGFQLTCGLMLVFYGYSVMKNPRVWGDQGRQAVKAENFPEYCRQNGLFFLKAGFLMALIGALDALFTLSALLYLLLYVFGLAFAFYPLTRWCKANEGFSWPWPRVESEKKRIKKLRAEQESQENNSNGSYEKGTPHGVPFSLCVFGVCVVNDFVNVPPAAELSPLHGEGT